MSELTPVLLLSYFFPPLGMAGSARAYGLFRYLPEFGYRPYVVTVREIVYPAYDTTLLTTADERYIVRTESLDPSRLLWRLGRRNAPVRGLGNHLPRWITPDYKRLWVPFALRAAKRLVAERDIRLVLTTSPTPSAHLIGEKLRRTANLDWVADFRDLWVTRPIEDAYLREAQKKYCRNLLSVTRRLASRVIAVNSSIAAYTGAETVIPNGVDPLTCDAWETRTVSDGVFRIGYLGTTDSEKTITRFVTALAGTLRERGLESNAVQVRFVGAVDTVMLQACFAKAGLSGALECHGYLPRGKAIRTLAEVDTLLVTIPDDLPFVTPSKVFDCLVSGKPLIALAPQESELARIVTDAGERVFDRDRKASLQERLSELLEAKRSVGVCRDSALQLELAQSRRGRHTWRAMAQSVARVFDEIAEKKPGEL